MQLSKRRISLTPGAKKSAKNEAKPAKNTPKSGKNEAKSSKGARKEPQKPPKKRVPTDKSRASGARRQRTFRAAQKNAGAIAIKDAVDAAERRDDHRITSQHVLRTFAALKMSELLGQGKKELPPVGEHCTFVKTERGSQYLLSDTVIAVATQKCKHQGENWIIFENKDWRGRARRPSKRRPERSRFVAIRSLHVARAPPGAETPEFLEWLREGRNPKPARKRRVMKKKKK